mmetsp:Transcript_6257/g.26505  ORF Transcript_6257/g.26505 Transcript_6257/m.26505 type:complete len:111 (+) Transcript_6257:973-1305(+)
MLLHRVHRRFGDRVRVHGVVADNLQGLSWIRENYAAGSNVALFLGSSIGNFPTEAARSFLAGVQKSLNRGDKLLIGFDLLKVCLNPIRLTFIALTSGRLRPSNSVFRIPK